MLPWHYIIIMLFAQVLDQKCVQQHLPWKTKLDLAPYYQLLIVELFIDLEVKVILWNILEWQKVFLRMNQLKFKNFHRSFSNHILIKQYQHLQFIPSSLFVNHKNNNSIPELFFILCILSRKFLIVYIHLKLSTNFLIGHKNYLSSNWANQNLIHLQ